MKHHLTYPIIRQLVCGIVCGIVMLFLSVSIVFANTLLLDFGSSGISSPDSNSNYWNNITTANPTIADMVDSSGSTTGIGFESVDSLSLSANTSGWAPDTLLPAPWNIGDGHKDGAFTNSGTTGVSFKITDLNPAAVYTFDFYAGRLTSSEIRITLYTVTGATSATTTLQTSGTNLGGTGINYNNSTIATIEEIAPDGSGEIVINFKKDSGLYGYLNMMRITETIPTGPTIDTQPADVTIDGGTTTTLSVSATASSGTLTYQWYEGVSGTTTDPIVGATSASYTTPTLNTAGTYDYWVQVSDDDGSKNSDTATVTVEDVQAPVAISDLSSTAQTHQTVTLSWTAPSDNDTGTASYNVRYSTSNITNDTEFNNATAVSGVDAPQAAGATESLLVEGLTPETTYYFAIKTTDAAGNVSDLSNVLSAATGPLPAFASIVDWGGTEMLVTTGATLYAPTLPTPTDVGTARTWEYSASNAIFPTAGLYEGPNLYGTLMSDRSGGVDDFDVFQISNSGATNVDSILLQTNAGILAETAKMQGMLFIQKNEFLSYSDKLVIFNDQSNAYLNWTTFSSSSGGVRVAVLDDGQWYLSESVGSGYNSDLTIADLSAENWGVWDPTGAPLNATPSTFDTLGSSFTNIQAVGVYFDLTRTNNFVQVQFADIEIVAGYDEVITIPNEPTSLSPTTFSHDGTSFTAIWEAVAGATGYYLDVSTSKDFSTFVSGYENRDVGDVTEYAVSGLTEGNVHYYRVRATNSAGTSDHSETIVLAPHALVGNQDNYFVHLGMALDSTLTLDAAFGSTAGTVAQRGLLADATGIQADLILLYDGSSSIAYYFNTDRDRWELLGDSSQDRGSVTFAKGDGLCIRRQQATDGYLMLTGVPFAAGTRPSVSVTEGTYRFIGIPKTSPTPINQLGLEAHVNSATSSATDGDVLFIPFGTHSQMYFYHAGTATWYDGAYRPAGTVEVPANGVILIKRKAGTGDFTWEPPID